MLAKDYVRYRLTGALATEPSDASATLMYDTARLRWREGVHGGGGPTRTPRRAGGRARPRAGRARGAGGGAGGSGAPPPPRLPPPRVFGRERAPMISSLH